MLLSVIVTSLSSDRPSVFTQELFGLSPLALAALFVPLWIGLVIVYRLTLHPLAHYPGPLLWKISGWPDAFAARSGTRHLQHTRLHHKYGKVIRIGPNRISVNSAQAFHDLNTNRNANVAKSGFVEFTRDVNDATHLQQIIDKQEHAQRRKIMGHAFTDSALKSAETFMITQIQNWSAIMSRGCDKSVDGWSETKNLAHWTNLLTLDVFGQLCFGEDFHASDNGDHKIVRFAMMGAMLSQKLAYLPIVFLIKPILRTQTLLKLLSRKTYDERWSLRKYVDVLIEKRSQAELDSEKNQTEIRKDFFHYVLKGRDDDGNMLPLRNYAAEAVLLIVAGTDTTSTALSSTLFYLNKHPDKLARLQAEITNAFNSVDEIHTGPTLSSLTYLRACVEEAIRMTPPVPGSLSRVTLAGGAMVDNTHIPAGTHVDVPIYALARNEAYFPDCNTYLPERWIVGSKTPNFEVTEELVARQRNAFVMFSTGPRNCLGMRMAYMEMGIVVSRLLYLFDMRWAPEAGPVNGPNASEFVTEDWFISGKEGPLLQFKPRNGVVGSALRTAK